MVPFFDPIGLADATFYGGEASAWKGFESSNEASIAWLRHAEIKHGRVAMFAFVGYIVHANGVHWPWPMQVSHTASGAKRQSFDRAKY